MKSITVFIPEEEDRNPFFNEIMINSSLNFVHGAVNEYREDYEIVNIQWPEKLFNWIPPSKTELNQLELSLKFWKKHSKIIYTLHDASTHYDSKNQFGDLFKLIHKYTDGVIHLGEFSLKAYKDKFSNASMHTVIYHPLYDNLKARYSKSIDVAKSNVITMFVSGNIRDNEERHLIIEAFKALPIKNKKLVVPRMYYSIKTPSYLPYRFSKYYKHLVKRYYNYLVSSLDYNFSNVFLSNKELVIYTTQSDFLFIPRKYNLNSGNLFLGITFDKLVVSPDIGNLSEVVEKISFPRYNPKNNKSLKQAMQVVADKLKSYNFKDNDYLQLKYKLSAVNSAKNYDSFIKNILDS